ncbi:MAG TPA: hypothetical protein VGL53_30275 [Bryobacteraceae bacterium]
MRRDVLLWFAVVLGGCGYVGYPLPPAINIPVPVTNLRAAQVGDQMIVEFTEPLHTTAGLPSNDSVVWTCGWGRKSIHLAAVFGRKPPSR